MHARVCLGGCTLQPRCFVQADCLKVHLTSHKAAGLQPTLLLPGGCLLVCVLDHAAEGHGTVGGIFSLAIEALKPSSLLLIQVSDIGSGDAQQPV